MVTDPPLALSLLLLAAALALFWWPGFAIARRLHGGDGFFTAFEGALGLGWSLAVFALVGWPFLWLGWTLEAFLPVLGLVWCGYLVLACLLWLRRNPTPTTIEGKLSAAIEPDSRAVSTLVLVGVYLLFSIAAVGLARMAYGRRWGWEEEAWTVYGIGVAILWLSGGFLVWRQKRRLEHCQPQPGDDRPGSGLARWLALAFILAQAASAVVLDRPDWDDVYYLAAILDYSEGGPLNAQDPSHRDGFPINAHNRLIAWELWAAVLCRISSLNPMALMHTFLPGILVLAAYAAYWQLLAEFVPRRWAAWGMLGLAAYHVWGISSHGAAANYLLPRLWQGKAVLLHIAVPLAVVLLTRYLRGGGMRSWLSLAATVVFGLAASSSGVFLLPILLSCLVLAEVGILPWGTWLARSLGTLLVTLPAVAYGLMIRAETVANPAIQDATTEHWTWETWFAILGGYQEDGAWEGLWFLLLPVLWLLLYGPKRTTYLVRFPLILLLLYANPLWCDAIARHLTGQWTYFRVFWLFPAAAGFGALVAMLSRLAGLGLGGRLGIKAAVWGGGVACALVAASWFLPGLYVWGPANTRSPVHPHELHPRSPNLMKVPPDLLPLAVELSRRPDVADALILCPESIANYLTPFSTRLRLVQARPLYTLPFAALAGRTEEGEKRYLLSLLLDGIVPGPVRDPEDLFIRRYFGRTYLPHPPSQLSVETLTAWLDELGVQYAVTETSREGPAAASLRCVGFQPELARGKYTLWKRMR